MQYIDNYLSSGGSAQMAMNMVVESNDIPAVEYLISRGVPPSPYNLSFAIANNRLELTRLFLKYLNPSKEDFFHSIQLNNYDMVKLLVDYFHPDIVEVGYNSAVLSNNFNLANLLLHHGAHPTPRLYSTAESYHDTKAINYLKSI